MAGKGILVGHMNCGANIRGELYVYEPWLLDAGEHVDLLTRHRREEVDEVHGLRLVLLQRLDQILLPPDDTVDDLPGLASTNTLRLHTASA